MNYQPATIERAIAAMQAAQDEAGILPYPVWTKLGEAARDLSYEHARYAPQVLQDILSDAEESAADREDDL